MELRDLRYFVAVAHTGNTRRAAELMHRSQPALIKAIDRLEHAVGARLFTKDGRGQRLSHAGKVLLARALPLLDNAEATRNEIAALGSGAAGLIRLGSGPLGADYLLPQITRLLMQEAPDIRLQLTIRMNYELRMDLRSNALDIVLGFVPGDGQDDEFIYHTLLKDTVVIAAGQDHPIFQSDRIGMETLKRYRWTLPNISVASRVWLDQCFSHHDLPRPEVQIETNSIPLIPQVIADTELLSFVSRRTIQASNGRLREVPLPETTLERNFGLTVIKDVPLSPAASHLLELLRTHGQTLYENATESRA